MRREATNRAVLLTNLRSLDVVVDQAEDGVEALERIDSRGPYDLVLLDDNMPHLCGPDAARQLRSRCGFAGEKGCLLTPGTRPTVCTAYYCPSYKQDLVDQQRWDALARALLELNDGRRGMNFRLNLSRRFVLKQVTKAGSTHPLDFVWDRLRVNGADIGAAGKRKDKGRLPVLS